MNTYPLVFEMEETMTSNSFGKTAREYRLPSKAIKHVPSNRYGILLASLHDGNDGLELYVRLERKPGNNFEEGKYYLSRILDGTRSMKFLPSETTFSCPDALKVFLAKELRNHETLPQFNHHALAYVEVYYPHMTKKLQSEIEESCSVLLQINLRRNGYGVGVTMKNGRLSFIVHAVDPTFKTEEQYILFQQIVSGVQKELLKEVKEITLKHRLKKGLKDVGISWSINRKHYAIMSKIHRIDFNMRPQITDGEEIISITSKGITLSIEAAKSFNKEHMDYTVWVKENGLKPKKLKVTFYSDDLDKHIPMLKNLFLDVFLDELENLHFIVKQCRTFSKNLEDWTQKQFEPIANDIAGAFAFNLYGIKTTTNDKLSESHRLIFLSTSELLFQKGMSEAVANLMEETLMNQ